MRRRLAVRLGWLPLGMAACVTDRGLVLAGTAPVEPGFVFGLPELKAVLLAVAIIMSWAAIRYGMAARRR